MVVRGAARNGTVQRAVYVDETRNRKGGRTVKRAVDVDEARTRVADPLRA
jgi:hypothetical protein